MAEIYTVDTGTGTRVEFYRKPGETTYEIHVFIKVANMTGWEEVEGLVSIRYAPAKVEEVIDKSRALGCKVTTPYDDDIAHEQNH